MPMARWRDYEIKKAKDLGVKTLIASINGYGNIDDTVTIAQMAQDAGADMLELVGDYFEAGDLVDLLSAVRKVARIPIIVKVNGNWNDTELVAQSCDRAGADAITAIDSIGPTFRVDIATGRPLLGGKGYGYMTGAPILPIALRYVHDIAKSTKKDLIGLGGVTTPESAMEMLMAGATAVGVCSAAIIRGPEIFRELTEGLNKLMDRYGYPDIPSVSGVTLKTEGLKDITTGDFVYEADRCVHCNRCITGCAYRARSFDEKGNMHVDSDVCRRCGLCFGLCPKHAIYVKPE
jgi:dihydroorotate dehydrogenase/NAD-dependent dihydropyrimidine dehydrogenase PreA subunit